MDDRKRRGTTVPSRSELRLLVLRALAGGSAVGLSSLATGTAASRSGQGAGTLDAYLAGEWRGRLDRGVELAANDLARAGLVRLTPANDMQISSDGRALLGATGEVLARANAAVERSRMRPALSNALLRKLSPAYRQWQDGPPLAATGEQIRKAVGRPERTIGIVAAIDMLGTKEAGRERGQIELQYLWKGLADLARRILRPEDGFAVTTESDAIKVMGSGRSTAYLLKAFGMASWRIVAKSMQYNVPVRGCVAVGVYYAGLENLVTGSAVNEANAWHDRAQWIGVAATPSACAVLDAMEKADAVGLDAMHEYYARYDIPSKTGADAAWAVNWPRQCEATGKGGGTKGMMQIIRAGLGRSPDKGAERKWLNAGKFCDSVICGWDPYRKWESSGRPE